MSSRHKGNRTAKYTDLKFANANFGGNSDQYEGTASIKDNIYWTAHGSDVKHYFDKIWGNNGDLRLMDAAANFPTAYATITIVGGTVINGYTMPETILYVDANGQWTTEEQTPPEIPDEPVEVTFDSITNNAVDYSGLKYTDLKFTNANFGGNSDQYEGTASIKDNIYWTAHGSDVKHYFDKIWGNNGDLRLMDAATSFPTAYATITIVDGTVINGYTLSETILYVDANGQWTTEEQTPPVVEVETANFERVAGCVMDGSVWTMHSILYVKFDKALAPTTTSIHGTGTANNSGNLKDKMTMNGEAIAMGSQINFYVNTFYSAEGANTTILEIMFVNATASDYAKGTILHIPEGTLFGDVALSEVTLTFNGATWVDETKLTRVEFVEIDANRNNNNVWGMNYVTILYFDKPLYAEAMNTALAETVAGDLGTNLTLNGVTAKELGVAITFASLSQEGRFGLEIHIPVGNMPKFGEELTQIILKIEEGTIFLNNILPELTFYLNEESKWQTDEFTYVYVPLMEVEFTGVSFRYNNDNNTWQTEGEWYLTVFEFSDFLSKTEIKGNPLPLGDKITLNGVKTSELGFIFGIGAYGTSMNVQYPKAALLSILDAPRIELALAEPITYGDAIIQPFKLYLNKEAIKWELIDGTDTTAPEITYNGAMEITTSAEKPFVIDVSSFDKEDNKSAVIYYVWSDGALDESDKLVKGTHTCTVVAVDKSGNESKIVLTVNVGDKDNTAPVISVPDTISAVEGAIPTLTYKATDDMDGEILCEIAWSEGALDESGKLVAGTHTMTLTATDLTGNTETKTVTVNVVAVDVPVDDTESGDNTGTNDTPDPDSAKPSDTGCGSSIGTSFAMILLAGVVGMSAVRFIKRKKTEDK